MHALACTVSAAGNAAVLGWLLVGHTLPDTLIGPALALPALLFLTTLRTRPT